MRKFTKVCIAVSGVLVVISIIFFVVSAVLGFSFAEAKDTFRERWPWNKFGHSQDVNIEEERAFWTHSGVKSLNVNISAGECVIQEGEGNEVRVEYDGDESRLTQTLEDGVLTIGMDDVEFSSLFDDEERTVYLYLPLGTFYESVELNVAAGTIYGDRLTAKEISVDVGAGSCDISELTAEKKADITVAGGNFNSSIFVAGEASFDCGIGNMNISGKIGNIDVDCGVGSINLELEANEKDYNYKIQCGVGNIDINGESYTALSKNKEINNSASATMDLDCGVGNINVNLYE